MKEKKNVANQRIGVYWWRYHKSQWGNFGDELTPLLLERLLHVKPIWMDPDECDLVGAGSILEVMHKEKNDNKPYVWGTGLIEDSDLKLNFSDYHFIGVRGKLTLSRIDGVPANKNIPLGDPGLIANTLLDDLPSKKYHLGVIPHYLDQNNEMVQLIKLSNGAHVIDPTANCIDVIRDIAACQAVISSSLHGLIVADSLGIPNTHTPFSSLLKGGIYKFQDYYSVFDNLSYSPIYNDELLKYNALEIADIVNQRYTPPSNLHVLQESITKSIRSITDSRL